MPFARPIFNRACIGVTDPLFASVKLLLPFDGADGAQSTLDRSPTPKVVTFGANALLEADRAKWGSTGLDLAELADSFISAGAAADWKFLHDGTTAWSIEGWFQLADFSTDSVFLATNSGGSTSVGVYLSLGADRKFTFFISRGVSSSYIVSTSLNPQTGFWPNDTALHFLRITFDPALTTAACDIQVDGVSLGTLDKTGNAPSTADPAFTLKVGRYGAGSGTLDGGLDDLRISSVIRSGPVPTEAFPLTS